MHIGFITSHFPFSNAKSVGGIGTSIKNLSDQLVYLGNQVSVFVYGQELDEFSILEGIHIYKIKNIKLKGISWFLTRKKIQKVIFSVHEKTKIDIVEAPDWEGITSYINLPIPIVIRLNGSDTYFCHLDKRPVKWMNKFQEKRALQKANGHISVSQFTADITNQVFQLAKIFTIIPNGINTSLFESARFSTNKSQTILYFGGIIRKKGVLEIPHYFNEVITKVGDAKLVLIGQDMVDKFTGNTSTYQMMQQLFTQEAAANVTFLGSIPYQSIKSHIQNATVCIFPSYAEALPVSWIEAMAMQKPVVASNVGWAKEIIDDCTDGFLVSPNEHSVFANRIVELLQNVELQKKIATAARRKIEQQFSATVVAEKSLSYYKTVIERT